MAQGDGRPFWRLIVSEATGCNKNDYFEELYEVKYGFWCVLSFLWLFLFKNYEFALLCMLPPPIAMINLISLPAFCKG